MVKRKKITPQWLSIVRKVYTYIGSTSLFTALGGMWDMSDHQLLFVTTMYLIGLNLIQTICDASYQRDEDIYIEK
jgi:hypothetical protein